MNTDSELRTQIYNLLIFHAGWDVGAELTNEVNDWVKLFNQYSAKQVALARLEEAKKLLHGLQICNSPEELAQERLKITDRITELENNIRGMS